MVYLFKLSFSEYKKIQKMNQKELSLWVNGIYENGFNDGWEACRSQPGETMDWDLVKIAIRATEGIGEKKSEAIFRTVEKLCFSQNNGYKNISDKEKGAFHENDS